MKTSLESYLKKTWTKQKKNKIFLDIYLNYNLGDDLFLKVFSDEFSNYEITLNYVGTKYDSFIKKYPNVRKMRYKLWHKILRRLHIYDALSDYKKIAKQHDILVFLGGSIFREESYWNELYKQRLSLQKSFIENNRKVFVLGANFGPVETQEFIDSYSLFFKRCNYIYFRDSMSAKLFEDINNINVVKDIVFSLEAFGQRDKKGIAISVIEPRHKYNMAQYREKYIDNIKHIIVNSTGLGYVCTLFSFCEGEGDEKVIYEIYNSLPSVLRYKVNIWNYKGNIEETLREFSRYEIVVATRFHSAILALINNQKLIPICYSDKLYNVLIDLGVNKESIYSLSDMDEFRDYLVKNNYEKINKVILPENISYEAKRQFLEIHKCFASR